MDAGPDARIEDYPRRNVETFAHAFSVSFQYLTGESWSEVMYWYMQHAPAIGVPTYGASIISTHYSRTQSASPISKSRTEEAGSGRRRGLLHGRTVCPSILQTTRVHNLHDDNGNGTEEAATRRRSGCGACCSRCLLRCCSSTLASMRTIRCRARRSTHLHYCLISSGRSADVVDISRQFYMIR